MVVEPSSETRDDLDPRWAHIGEPSDIVRRPYGPRFTVGITEHEASVASPIRPSLMSPVPCWENMREGGERDGERRK